MSTRKYIKLSTSQQTTEPVTGVVSEVKEVYNEGNDLTPDDRGEPEPTELNNKTKPAKLRPLTRKQKAFADYLLNNPKASATEAYRESYNATSDTGMRVESSRTLAKPNVQVYLENHADKALQDNLELAAISKVKGVSGNLGYASLAAQINQQTMDRAWGKATQKVEQTSTGVIISVSLNGLTTDSATD